MPKIPGSKKTTAGISKRILKSKPNTVKTSIKVNGKESTIETPNTIKGRRLNRKLSESLDSRPTGVKVIDNVTKGILSIKGIDAALDQAGMVNEAESIRRITNEWSKLVERMDRNPKLADAVSKVLKSNLSSAPSFNDSIGDKDNGNTGNQIIQI